MPDTAPAAPPSAPTPDSERARRARENGARSRGPKTAAGKARSSRNALRHGLSARVHLVLDAEDEIAFQGLGSRLFAELAPTGELEGFLVARLAAAMWKTGRAERLEGDAFARLGGVDAGRLDLALRYQGSVARELFRCLRELKQLRKAPLAEPAAPIEAEPEPADGPDPAGADPSDAALVAWGCQRPPPGFLLLRPVPHTLPRRWRELQHLAHPAAAPLWVDEAGNVRDPRTGESVAIDPPPPPPSWLSSPSRRAAGNQPEPPEPSPSASTGACPAEAPVLLRYGLTLSDLEAVPAHEQPEPPTACPEPTTELQNEPTPDVATAPEGTPSPPQSIGHQADEWATPAEEEAGSATPAIEPIPGPGAWERAWGLAPPALPKDAGQAPSPPAIVTSADAEASPLPAEPPHDAPPPDPSSSDTPERPASWLDRTAKRWAGARMGRRPLPQASGPRQTPK